VKVLKVEKLTPSAYLIKVKDGRAPLARPGQFGLLLTRPDAFPLPLPVYRADAEGFTFLLETDREPPQELYFLEAPLGKPFPLERYGRVLLIGRKTWLAALAFVKRALKETGNEPYLVELAGGNGTYGLKEIDRTYGNAEEAFEDYLRLYGPPDLVVTAGSNADAARLAELTKRKGVKHLTAVNAPVVDACGLCTSCRLKVGGKEKLACVDGPWFNAHEVDWPFALERERLYEEEKALALKRDASRPTRL